MEIEAKLIEPGEAKVEIRMVATLAELMALKEELPVLGNETASRLISKIRETAEQLNTVVSGENTDG